MASHTNNDRLDELIDEAIVDAYGEDEQLSGFHVMIEDKLELPFETDVLGVQVTVTGIALLVGTGIVAVCERGRHRQAIGVLDLPLPDPPPAGAEWIEAFRRWAG
ncbi:calcium-binding protein [Streptosporangium saharense]|uniref:calcium-binding protein n=1 Tax=Streptosporangium saharense TaxID=1706840 RepID=UPI00331C3734